MRTAEGALRPIRLLSPWRRAAVEPVRFVEHLGGHPGPASLGLGDRGNHSVLLRDILLDPARIRIAKREDPSTSHGRLQLALFAGLAQYERELINERVRAGVATAQARGVRFGRPAPKKETVETRVRAGPGG